MLVDLDHFKQVNDQHGHDVGDSVLVEVSGLLERLALEHNALCGRWGGEEFAVYLPNASRHKAMNLAKEPLNNSVRSAFQSEKPQIV